MKIAIIGSAHPLRGGGIATFNERLAAELQAQGHEVVIVSFSLQYPSFLFPGKSQFTDEPAPDGLTIRSAINSVNPLNWISVGRQMNKEKYDLIVVRFWIPFMGPAFGTILRLARRNGHTRVLCIADNLIPHEGRPGDKQFTNYFIKPLDAFITMSRDVLKDVHSLSTKPAAYTPHPLYDTYGPAVSKAEACRHLKLDAGGQYMLFFGFIRDYKGLDMLLLAMTDERLKKAGIKLIVAGEYYGKAIQATCEQIIAEHGLQDRVILHTGFIANNEIRYFFSAADVVVLPYRDATQSGITQVAYHFEKPIIVTNVGGLAEVVPDGKVGFVAEPDPASIAGAILKFFGPASIPGIRENILHEKQKYQWDTFTRVLLSTAFGK